MSRVAWLLAAIVVAAPAAAADRSLVRVEVRLDPSHPEVTTTTLITGDEAQREYEAMDRDEDHAIDASERRAYSGANAWRGQHAPGCLDDFHLFQIDDRPPRRLVAYDVDQGPSEAAGLGSDIERTERFVYATPQATDAVPVLVDFGRLDTEALGRGCMAETPLLQASLAVNPRPGGDPLDPSAVLLAGPTEGTWLDLRGVDPSAVRRLWHQDALRAGTPEERALISQPVRSAIRQGAAPEQEPFRGVPVGSGVPDGLVAGVAALAGLAGLVATEAGRLRLVRGLAALGLYSRLSRDEVLEHARRDELFQLLRHRADGPSLADLRRITGYTHGTIVHHLRMMEQKGLVLAVRDGFRTRFFLRGPRVVPPPYLTPVQQRMLDAVRGEPGLTQQDLAVRLGLPREAVSYHARRLQSAGALEIRPSGRSRRHFPREAAHAAPPAAAAVASSA